MEGNSSKRLWATPADSKGPTSLRSRAYRALLRDIDWALSCGSAKWTNRGCRTQSYEEFLQSGVAWKFEGRTTSGVMVPHDNKSIQLLASHFVAAGCRKGVPATAKSLYERGSEIATPEMLATIGYDRETEMSAVRNYHGKRKDLPKALWSTFDLDSEPKPHEDSGQIIPDSDRGDETAEDDAEDDAHYSNGREANLGNRNPRNPQSIARKKRQQVQEALRAVGDYLDEHCRGRQVDISGRQVSRDIAALHNIDYFDERAKQFRKRTADHYFELMTLQVKHFNARYLPNPRKTTRNLLWEGSAMMLGLQLHGIDTPQQRRDSGEDENGSSSVVLMEPGEAAKPSKAGRGRRSGVRGSEAVPLPRFLRRSGSPLPSSPKASPSLDIAAPQRKLERLRAGQKPSVKRRRLVSGSPHDYEEAECRDSADPSHRQEVALEPPKAIRPCGGSGVSEGNSIAVASSAGLPAIVGLRPPIIPRPDSTVFSLQDRDVEHRLTQICAVIRTATSGLFDVLSTVAMQRATAFNKNPSSRLEAVYRSMVDGGHVAAAFRTIEEALSPKQLAVAILASTLYSDVLASDVGTSLRFAPYLEKWQSDLGNDRVALLDSELRDFQTTLDTLIRRLYLRRISTREFRDVVIAEIANEATLSITHVLLEHLRPPKKDLDVLQEAIDEWVEGMRSAVSDALVLKCELSCAREAYVFRMARSGEIFNYSRMEDTHGGNRKSVLVSMFPGLHLERKDGVEVVSKMQVRTTAA